jgi:hypothetical protein
MEIADVRKKVVETIERAKRGAAEHRTRADEAGKAYELFLDHTAVPMCRQIVNVLRAHGHAFNVFTPGGSVRLAPERGTDDYIELTLDTTGDEPVVVGHTRRSRGRRVVDSERPVGDPATLNEEDVLAFVLKELEPFVDR